MIEINILLFVVGLCVGSFLNVLIDRLSNDESILGRSHCDHCKKPLSSFSLVPVISFIFQGGRSSCCGKKISWYYPMVELLTATIFVASYYYWGFNLVFGANLVVLLALVVIFFADIKYHIIPDEATATILLVAVVIAFYRGEIADRLIAGCVLFMLMHGLYLITNKRGVGYGDVKLAGVFGVYLGLFSGFLALYFSFMIGGLVSLLLILSHKKKLKSRIAFGPFMVAGMIIMMLWGSLVGRTLDRLF